jgi:predicted ATPase
MDGASLDLLLHLARHTHDAPILLLCSYRESEVPWPHPLAKGIQDLGRAHLVERIELQQFSWEGTVALMKSLLFKPDLGKVRLCRVW